MRSIAKNDDIHKKVTSSLPLSRVSRVSHHPNITIYRVLTFELQKHLIIIYEKCLSLCGDDVLRALRQLSSVSKQFFFAYSFHSYRSACLFPTNSSGTHIALLASKFMYTKKKKKEQYEQGACMRLSVRKIRDDLKTPRIYS